MCKISRAYDAYCDSELENYSVDPEPSVWCSCCCEPFYPEETINGDCIPCHEAVQADLKAEREFIGPPQVLRWNP